MKAIAHVKYGRPHLLRLHDVEVPGPGEDEVLLRVRASSVNPVEWYGVTGFLPARIGGGFRRPKSRAVGADVAGVVEAVGAGIESLRPGDDVFGTSGYSWAEYATARPERLARKPANVSFEEAAALPVAGITALQGLRDHGRVQAGQRVLVNGASGGVGTFAVQLAKAFGAEVTAVCSTAKVDLVRSLGADRVVDYTRKDFTAVGERHDLMLDIAGSRSFTACRRALTPDATVVVIGGPMTYRGLGPLPHIAGTMLKAKRRSQQVKFFVAKVNTDDLTYLAELLEARRIKAVIDRTYPLAQAADALAYLGEGHARAKVVLTI
jgi:NADPH:quinone reductase-like Zn-dependent oxidoreductase